MRRAAPEERPFFVCGGGKLRALAKMNRDINYGFFVGGGIAPLANSACCGLNQYSVTANCLYVLHGSIGFHSHPEPDSAANSLVTQNTGIFGFNFLDHFAFGFLLGDHNARSDAENRDETD